MLLYFLLQGYWEILFFADAAQQVLLSSTNPKPCYNDIVYLIYYLPDGSTVVVAVIAAFLLLAIQSLQ